MKFTTVGILLLPLIVSMWGYSYPKTTPALDINKWDNLDPL